jgi:hypothetical protein
MGAVIVHTVRLPCPAAKGKRNMCAKRDKGDYRAWVGQNPGKTWLLPLALRLVLGFSADFRHWALDTLEGQPQGFRVRQSPMLRVSSLVGCLLNL